MKIGQRLITILLLISLTACGQKAAAPSGRLLIWHTWNDAEAPILEQILADFQRLHPQISLTVERKPYDETLGTFIQDSRAGLGPDVLIGIESVYAHFLYEQELITDLSASNVDWTLFDTRALQSVQRNDGATVGVPLNAYVHVLFYNRSLLAAPPTSLTELEEMGKQGVKIGIPTTFFASYWGVTGLGGSVFDENRLSPDSLTSIATWLEWFSSFRKTPGAVLSPDMRALVESFKQGDIAALIADSLQISNIEEGVQNPDLIGIAPIPGYPASQPFSTVELMVVSSASTQKDAAALLINFLANETQQRRFARSTSGRAPVNRYVTQLDPTLYPQASVILQQVRASIVPTAAQDQILNALILSADPIYQQVLEGILSPQQGAQQIIEQLQPYSNGK